MKSGLHKSMMQCKLCLIEKDLTKFIPYKKKNSIGYRKICRRCTNKLTSLRSQKIDPSDFIKQKEDRTDPRLKRYGLTNRQYSQLLLEQNNACAICTRTVTEFKNRLSVDHCHYTNRVRGLLCSNCNTVLGLAKDNIYVLKRAIEYLQQRANGYSKLYSETTVKTAPQKELPPLKDSTIPLPGDYISKTGEKIETDPAFFVNDIEAQMPNDSDLLFWSTDSYELITESRKTLINKVPEDK